MQLRPWLSKILALALAVTPAAAQEFNIFTPWQQSNVVALTLGACEGDTDSATTYNSTTTPNLATLSTGMTATQTGYVILMAGGGDNANSFSVSSATINGVAAVSVVTTNGTTETAAARMFISATPLFNAATVDVTFTFSEAVVNGGVCAAALANLNSPTATSTANTFSNSGASLALTTSTTTSGGYVIGWCYNPEASKTFAWGVLTSAGAGGTNADASWDYATAAATGSSMSNTCDTSGTADVAGVAAAFR